MRKFKLPALFANREHAYQVTIHYFGSGKTEEQTLKYNLTAINADEVVEALKSFPYDEETHKFEQLQVRGTKIEITITELDKKNGDDIEFVEL